MERLPGGFVRLTLFLALMPLALVYATQGIAPEAPVGQRTGPDGQPAYSPLLAGTLITSDILTDTIWTAAGSPYHIRGDRPGAPIAVAASATLTVESGVVIAVTGALNVFGRLAINGVPEARVTVYQPEAPGYIILNGLSVIRNTDFYSLSLRGPYGPLESLVTPDISLDGIYFTQGTIGLTKGTLRLTNSVLSHAGVAAPTGIISRTLIWLGSGLSLGEGSVTHNSILGNYGGVGAGSAVTVTENNIYGNYRGTKVGPLYDLCVRPYNITNLGAPCGSSPVNFVAPNNWWGTTDISSIGSRVSPNVDFLPIATAPIADAPRLYAAYLPWVNNGAGGW